MDGACRSVFFPTKVSQTTRFRRLSLGWDQKGTQSLSLEKNAEKKRPKPVVVPV